MNTATFPSARLAAVDEDLRLVGRLLAISGRVNIVSALVVLLAIALTWVAIADHPAHRVGSPSAALEERSLGPSSSSRDAIASSTSPPPSSPITDSILATASR